MKIKIFLPQIIHLELLQPFYLINEGKKRKKGEEKPKNTDSLKW